MKTPKRGNPELGNKIRAATIAHKWYGEELARRIGISAGHLSKLQLGKKPIPMKLLNKIAEALNIDPANKKEWMDLAQGISGQAAPIGGLGAAERLEQAIRVLSLPIPPKKLDEILKKLVAIIRKVEDEWKLAARSPQSATGPRIPEHGPKSEHNIRMAEILCSNFDSELKQLDENEFYSLFAAVFLHDLGFASEMPPLDQYELLAEEFVDSNIELLRLENVAQRVKVLCRYHRNLEPKPEELALEDRTRSLIGLLRLADTLDCRESRVRECTTRIEEKDIFSTIMRNHFCQRIYADRARCQLVVEYGMDTNWGQYVLESLRTFIEHDVQTVLLRVHEPMNRELRSNLFSVDVRQVQVSDQEAPRLKKLLDLKGAAASPHAAGVLAGVMTTLKGALSAAAGDASAMIEEAAFRTLDSDKLKRLREQVLEDVRYYQKLRPAHKQIENIREKIEKAINEENGWDAARQLWEIWTCLERYQAAHDRAHATIKQLAPEICGEPARLILFGYSGSVIAFCKGLTQEVRRLCVVYICECRAKSIYYDPGNAVEFIDGVEYSRVIRELGFPNLAIISDPSVSYFMDPRNALAWRDEQHAPARLGSFSADKELEMPAYVLLGADGIAPNGDVSGTIGTKSVVLSAHDYNHNPDRPPSAPAVKTYVMAEEGKIGTITWNQQGPRENNWLGTDPRVNRVLAGNRQLPKIEVARPNNEQVPHRLIDFFITENGVIEAEKFEGRQREPLCGAPSSQI